jgi:hypothetical protein
MTFPDSVQQNLIEESIVESNGTSYAMIHRDNQRKLAIQGDLSGFDIEKKITDDTIVCDLSEQNAAQLRERIQWLSPVALHLRTSAGFGDRLGVATVGHVQATRGTDVAPIFAQQSVRENARTGRTPQNVLDDAMWGVLQGGWHEAWGADADHMKTIADIDPFIQAGYTFYTIDPSEHVDDSAETADFTSLQAKVEALPWDKL